ncbi:MAG: 30S ribosomal protein S7 [Candidatus Bipolaricaulis sp.]|nr:30S ribosomal protein S7 [Candidatus Bipolaricaulis sp.]MDD5219315.1 30S ribosomal protein S7 [Candidatus Bipolaricaulis sp.]MDD5646589.1 30S ribosomal protein S7 [Candidatus Bipolaricaulis sp.]
MKLPGRDVKPDIRYNSKLLAKLINYSMLSGKKATAERIVYDALEIVEKRSNTPALDVFNEALANCSPRLEVRTRRVGGANYQVPYEVPADRQIALALRWLVSFSRARGEHTMAERLAGEILEASRKEGKAYNKRLDAHRMAESNKAFAHYRW